MTERLLTTHEAAKVLNVSRPYIYKMVHSGLLPAVSWSTPGKGKKPAPVVRIHPQDLQEFIQQHRRRPLVGRSCAAAVDSEPARAGLKLLTGKDHD